jgi:uncharacterized membrane protein
MFILKPFTSLARKIVYSGYTVFVCMAVLTVLAVAMVVFAASLFLAIEYKVALFSVLAYFLISRANYLIWRFVGCPYRASFDYLLVPLAIDFATIIVTIIMGQWCQRLGLRTRVWLLQTKRKTKRGQENKKGSGVNGLLP